MNEKDSYGLEQDISMEDLAILQDYKEVFSTPRGERILEHLKMSFHVQETKTIEEMLTDNGQPTQIDTTALLIREGMRRAYRFIENHIDGMDRITEARVLKEQRGE